MQDLYKSDQINSFSAKNLFKWRTRMMNLKNNFKTQYSDLTCQLCNDHLENNENLLKCAKIKENVEDIRNNGGYEYEELFGNDLRKMAKVGSLLDKAFSKRNELLEKL